MEFLINIANLLYILSYFVQDVFRIRVFTLLGALLLVAYFYLQPAPVMTIIYWNVFFILLNLMQLGRIFWQRHTGTDPVTVLKEQRRFRLGFYKKLLPNNNHSNQYR